MRVVNRVQPKYRLKHVWARAHAILDCYEDEADVGEDGEAVAVLGHGGCGHRQPVVRKEGLRLTLVYRQAPGEGGVPGDGAAAGKKGKADGGPNMPDKRDLTAEDAHTILAKIPPADLDLLGLSAEYAKPDWMILTVLPVPPPQVRPFVTTPGQPTAQDDLTYKLSDILKTNATVAQLNLEGAAGHVANDYWQLLQVGSEAASFEDIWPPRLMAAPPTPHSTTSQLTWTMTLPACQPPSKSRGARSRRSARA